MRVLYIHQYFVDPNGAGGTRSLEFARRLVRDGHEVTMLTSNAMMSARFAASARSQRHVIDGIDVAVVPVRYDNAMGPAPRLLAFAWFAVRSLRHILRSRRPDVIIATSTPLTVVIPGVFAMLWHRRRMVFEVRDVWPEVPIQMGYLTNPLSRGLARLMERTAYFAAAEIVALSPGMADVVASVSRSRRRITIVPNSSDVDRFGVAANASEPGAASGQPVTTDFVYAGTLGRANDVGWLVDVAAHLDGSSNARFVIVGAGAEREEIERRASAAGLLGDRILVVDPVPKDQMPAVLESAAVCLSLFASVSALETTSPNKLFDALAAGRPILVNYGGWQQELLERADCGFRLDRDPSVAALQVASLAIDPDRRRSMGRNARRLAESTFSREQLYREWRDVLLRVADARRRSP